MDTTIKPVTCPGPPRWRFDITVHPVNDKQNPRTFRTIDKLSFSGAEPLRGRGTRVFEAVELDQDGNPSNTRVALKDIWIDSDRKREGEILTLLHEAANDVDKHLIKEHFLTTVCHGDVWTDDRTGILDDTANALMRKLNFAPDDWEFELQRDPIRSTSTPTVSEGLHETICARSSRPYVRYAHKTHYRIVFAEVGNSLDRMMELPLQLPLVMKVFGDIVVGAF